MFFAKQTGIQGDGSWFVGRLPLQIMFVLLVFAPFLSEAQRGKIIKAATTTVMDPNGDGFVSESVLGFSNDGYNVDEFELKMFGIPKVGSGDTLADNQAGAKCGITDITVDNKGYGVYGVIDNSDNLIFRFRLGTDNPSVEAYTILIDTDGKMGVDDPNSTPENPGFEIDITLIKNKNRGVYVFNIDGIESCPDPLRNYSFDTHFQIATADVVSCSNPDYFYDFYVPFSALNELFGITKDTELRFAAVTNTSATCAMAGKISDVAGVNDNDYNGCNACAFLDLSTNQCPTSLNNLCFTCAGFQEGVTPKPTLRLPVKAGEDFISGFLKDPDGTPLANADIFVQVFNSLDVLMDRDTVLTDANGAWNSTFSYVLSAGDSVTARAKVADRCSSSGLGSQASFTIVVVNVPPQINGTTVATSYTENGAPLTIQPSLQVIDPDNLVLESATVTILTNFQAGQDQLSFAPVPGITGTYNVTTGILSFVGSASLASYQTILRSVAYSNSSDNPSALSRTIRMQVFDGLDVSNTVDRALAVLPVNDPPIVIGSAAQIQYTTGSLILDNTIGVTDLDNTQITGATVSITNNFVNGEDMLNFANQLGISGSYVPGTGILTLTGTATLANYSTALQSVTYSNNLQITTQLTRRITVVVSDGTASSEPFHKFVSVIPVNYPPVFVDGSNNPITSIPLVTPEDVPLSTCLTVIDPNGDPVTIGSINVISGSGAFTLTGGLCFIFTPGNNFNGIVTAEVTVCDPSSACATATIEVTVSPTNDAPALTGSSGVITYPGAAVVVDNTITVNDVDSPTISGGTVAIDNNFVSAEDVLTFVNQSGITGTYSSVTGVLTLTGSASLADYSSALRSITYTNTFQSSLLTRRITFQVSDGIAVSAPFNRFVEFSGNINRPPFLVDGSNNPVSVLPFGTTEDVPLSACITAIDPDGDPITVTSLVLVSGSGAFTATGGLCFTYVPVPDFSGVATATVTICDPNGACASGTIEVTVSPVNDPPVITGSSSIVIYTTGTVAVDNAISVSDPDNIQLSSATVSITSNFVSAQDVLAFTNQLGITGVYNSSTGVLTLTGVASLADYATALRSVTYANLEQFPSTLTRTISFVVNDGSANSIEFDRFIEVRQVNVAPQLTDGTNPVDTLYFTIQEDVPLITCVNASDANGDQVSITNLSVLTGLGNYTLNGGLCFTFVPGANFNGRVKSSITLCDAATNSLCIVAGIVITVQPVDDPPEITTTLLSLNQDESAVFCVAVTDTENDAAYFTNGISQNGFATITNGALTTDLCFSYTPNAGFFGVDLVDVTVCEVASPTVCSTKTISIDVKKVNHPPNIIVNGIPGTTIALTTPEDQPLVFCFESVDPDGDDVVLDQALNTAGGGSLVPYQNIEFCFTFTPEKNFYGSANWSIRVCDNGAPSLCGTLVALINVTPVNDAPIAVNDTLSVLRHTVSTANILLNDLEVDGDPITLKVQPVVNPVHGQAALSSDGTLTYTSDRYYRGIDSLVYEICDNAFPVACGQGTVHFVIGDLPLRIYEGVSPNGDGVNDYWRMDGIDYYAENVVRVFDRYNNLVYEMNNYNNEDRVWRGEANRGFFRGRLPDGVYFYSIRLTHDIPNLSGFVVLKME